MKGYYNSWFLLIMLYLYSALPSSAQYITLPDANFANFIAATYPSAVNASKQLDTNVAKTITGLFNANAKNINDVTGIEYFININRLYLSSNNLTFLPSLDRLTLLTRLEVDTNQLTTIPDLHALTSLKVLYCQYNNITVLPSMANMTSVQQFFCHHNQLTALPNISGMTSLYHFICSDNYITSLPNMSTLTSLNRFLCTNNKLISVDLTSIPNVTQVHLRNNKMPTFPNISGMTQLTQLHVDGNNFTTLPDLSSFINLNDVQLDNNYLTFEDLLPLGSLPGFSGFRISPQKLVGVSDTTIVKEKNSFNYSIGVDLGVTTNTYTWFKNGIQIGTSSSPLFTIASTQFSDAGNYSFQIINSNPLFASLTLSSQPMKLEVIHCMDISQIHYAYSQESCQSPVVLTIEEPSIVNAIAPISYQLKNILSNTTDSYTSPSLICKNYGLFELTILDASNCAMTLTSKIEINKKPGCDIVLYPDLEGASSTYFLNQQGKAIVYASSGQKLRELSLPTYWDGKDQHGKILDSGLYMIVVNDQTTIPISIMRTQ